MSAVEPPASLEASFRRDADIIQPFQLEQTNLRGRLVRLDEVLDDILSRHDYPIVVADLLAEALTVTALLGSMLKYDGLFSLQTRGDGPVPMVITDMSSDGRLRGYAKFDDERIAALDDADELALRAASDAAIRPSHELGMSRLLGSGYLAFTVDQGHHTERYQGIVELGGQSLADSVINYFRQSEQLDTGVAVKVRLEHGHWRGGGLILQRMPDDQARRDSQHLSNDVEDGWRRAMVMLGSLTTDEMVDAALPVNDLLYRLFNEDGVRVFERHPLVRDCRCSRERILTMLRNMPREALIEMAQPEPGDDQELAEDIAAAEAARNDTGPADEAEAVQGRQVEVTCEFCSTVYTVTLDEVFRGDA